LKGKACEGSLSTTPLKGLGRGLSHLSSNVKKFLC